AAPAPARPADAQAPLPARPPERLPAPRRRLGRAPERRANRLAPSVVARGRGARPAKPRDRVLHRPLRRRCDRDRPGRRSALRDRALEITNLLTDEESAIKDLVREKGLNDRFSFLPFTAETGEIYSALDIVTFPNQGVGLGRPVLEAATYGKPVVASGSRDGA